MNRQRLTGFLLADRQAFSCVVERLFGSKQLPTMRQRLHARLWRAEQQEADEHLQGLVRRLDVSWLEKLGRRELRLLPAGRAASLGVSAPRRGPWCWLARLRGYSRVAASLELVLGRRALPRSELLVHAGLHRLARKLDWIDFTQACWLVADWPLSWRRTFLATQSAFAFLQVPGTLPAGADDGRPDLETRS